MEAKAAWQQQRPDGRFRRKVSEFRGRIEADSDAAHPAEAGRYHLVVGHACPWAHRTLMTRALLDLSDITVSVVDWRMQPDGSWIYGPSNRADADPLFGDASLQDTYRRADADFAGIGTVPVLWDKQAGTIVNNESREIVRMFDAVLAPALGKSSSLLPPALTSEVDAMIDANYEAVNDGVYRCGFAQTQEAYDEAEQALFGRLDELDAHLWGRKFLVGEGEGTLTEADICLWPTLARFDVVYHTHFKCNRRLIAQYANLSRYRRRIYDLPGIAETVHWDHIRGHYYWSHQRLNPYRIIPKGPDPLG